MVIMNCGMIGVLLVACISKMYSSDEEKFNIKQKVILSPIQNSFPWGLFMLQFAAIIRVLVQFVLNGKVVVKSKKGEKSIGIILTMFMFSNWGITSTSAQAVISQGTVTVENNIHGNDVLKRAIFLKTGGRRAFLDFETSLPKGQLKQFFVYIHNCSNTQISADNAQFNNNCDKTRTENILIKLQIWRPIDIVTFRYSLVWTTDILVNFTSDTGFLVTYTLPNSETILTENGDRIGWTNLEDFGVISFGFLEGHKTYFLKHNQIPIVGTEYVFDSVHLPAIFSVAVDINPSIVCENEYRVDYDDIESPLWRRYIPNISFDADLALDGAGARSKIVVSSSFHDYFLLDFTYPVTVKNVSMGIRFGINITLELVPSNGGASTFLTESLPNFNWNNADFTGIDMTGVSHINITYNMDPHSLEMGIKRLYVTVCPECTGTTETIGYNNTAGLTLEVLPLPFANPKTLLAGSGKKRKVVDSKAIKATFNSTITIQMVRLQMRVLGSSTFNVTMYSSTTTTFANQLYTDQVAVPVIGAWSNNLHVLPFSPVEGVKQIIITFTFPPSGFVTVRNLALDKCT